MAGLEVLGDGEEGVDLLFAEGGPLGDERLAEPVRARAGEGAPKAITQSIFEKHTSRLWWGLLNESTRI